MQKQSIIKPLSLLTVLLFLGCDDLSHRVQKQDIDCSKDDLSLKILQICAEQNDVISQYNLGIKYRDGIDLEKSPEKAFYWINKAASQNMIRAEAELSLFYAKGFGVSQDSKKAFLLAEKAAMAGSIDATVNLGVYYQKGIGVEKDLKKAMEFYIKAADFGDSPVAKKNLGILYLQGIGVKKDINVAIAFLKAAAIQGDSEAMATLGAIYFSFNNLEESLGWTQKAVELNDSLGQVNLGYMYATGKGLPVDKDMAVILLNKSLKQNQPQAFFIMGTLYAEGDKIFKRNDKKAFEFYLQAANLGHGKAQNNVATWYFNGRFINKDSEEAVRWFLRAANENNIPESMYALSQIYGKGTKDISQDLEKSRYWLEKAKENGFVPPK